MTKRTRNITIVICAAASAASVAAFAATGMHGYTRFKSDETAAVNAETSLSDMFGDTGLDDEQGAMEQVENVTAIGLLPSGPGMESISVASITGPALFVAGAVFFVTRRKAARQQSTRETN